jgi:hypothetical protein
MYGWPCSTAGVDENQATVEYIVGISEGMTVFKNYL